MRSFAPAHAPLKVLRAVSFLFHYASFTGRISAVALAAVGSYTLMSTGGLYVQVLLPMIVWYSYIGTMAKRCPLVRTYSKWLDCRPTRITVIYSSRFSMPSFVISLTIRVIFYFWALIVSWKEMAVSMELGILMFWLLSWCFFVVLFKLDHIC